MRKYYGYIIIIILIIVYLTFTVNGAFQLNREDEVENAYKNNNLLRLHVIADSNSPHDQYLKRKVRNKLINYFTNLNKEEFEKKDIKKLEEYLLDLLVEQYRSDVIKLSIGNYSFPRRTYGNLTLDSGIYRALKVELGEGKGANWWCVLVPQLCLTDDDISNKSSSIGNIKYKFKFVEMFKNSRREKLENKISYYYGGMPDIFSNYENIYINNNEVLKENFWNFTNLN